MIVLRTKICNQLRFFGKAFVFAVLTTISIRWFVLDLFSIPSSSMENSLLIGDRIIVSKLHYGIRTPEFLLQLPFFNETTIGNTDIPTYLDWIKIPQIKLSGLSYVKSNDIIVFKNPTDSLNPFDFKESIVKRCLGTPGDSILLSNHRIHLGKKIFSVPKVIESKNTYLLEATGRISKGLLSELDISEIIPIQDAKYQIKATAMAAEDLTELTFIKSIRLLKASKRQKIVSIFDSESNHEFKAVVPKKGDQHIINSENINLYLPIIKKFEGHRLVSYTKDSLIVDGELVNNYTFRQSYFFMVGDNLNDSVDSRYWGFVPENHLIGKAIVILFSIDSHETGFNSFRYKRLWLTL